jgi:REP element-mobilizing transposase RayT
MTVARTNWNLAPPPGFQGLREDLPLQVYEQLLPHWRQDGATYFVTFRLNDSLPQEKLDELRKLKMDWENRRGAIRGLKSTPPSTATHGRKSTLRSARMNDKEELAREVMRRIEVWLDQGMGSCCLRTPELARVVVDAMHATDGSRCELGCYVVMPNHVHAVVRPLHPATDPLEKVLQYWKGSSARWINEKRGKSGTLWQPESYDRIIRDEEHLWRVIQYIGGNPASAKLSVTESALWIRPEWVELGWRFENA